MSELVEDKLKHDVSSKVIHDRKRRRSILDSEIQVMNDNSNYLPEHSIPKKKKKKKKRVNDEETVDEYKTQKENHEENTNLVTGCVDKIGKTNEISPKKGGKQRQDSDPLRGTESTCFIVEDSEYLSSTKVKKKKKKRREKVDENIEISNNHSDLSTDHSGLNSVSHRHIRNIDDSHHHRDHASSLENNSFESTADKNKDSEKPEQPHCEKVEKKRKTNKKTKSKKLIAHDNCMSDSNIEMEPLENSTSPKQTKQKENANDIGMDSEIEIKEEKLSDDENHSDSSDGIIIDEHEYQKRIKKPKLTPSELHLAKIVAYDESDDEQEIHPLQQHHQLDPDNLAKLSAIRINLPDDIPPQHKVEKLAGTRVPTKAEKHEMEKYARMKKGPFSKEEDARIMRNWRKFCKKYHWDKELISPFVSFKHKGFFYVSTVEQRKNFVQLLARKLPDRTLYSVYHRFRNLFSSHKQERYTFLEDRELMRSIQSNLDRGEKPNYAILAKKFNRTRASVWRRYTLLMKKKEEKTGSDETWGETFML